jgi:Tfp pilus assembly protein PilF/DNA-binding CsgD family transcriptional regulator
MFGRAFLLVLITLLAYPCCGQYEPLLHKTYAQRYISLESIFYTGKALKQDSAAFFKQVDALDATALKAGDEELQLEAQLLRCEYYMFGRQENHALFVRRALAFKEIADKKEIPHLQIRIRQKLGYYYFKITHKYGLGFDNYLSSYQLLKDIPVTELPDKQELVANIGTAYFQYGDNATARKFLTEAWAIQPSYKKRLPINLTNTLGLIYREEHKYDSADFYLRKSYRMAEAIKDSTWMGIAAGNIGISYYHQKKYDEAIPLLELDVRESIKANELDNALNSLIILTKISLLKNNLAIAQKQIGRVQGMLHHSIDSYRHKKELFPLLAKYFAVKGDSGRAFLYSDSARVVIDSLFTRRNSLLATKAERKFELQKHRADMQRLEAQEKLQETLRNSLIIGILLLIIIAFLLLNRQRLIHNQKQQKLQNEKNSIATELEIASQQLGDFTNHIREKNKLIEQFSAEIEKQKDLISTEDQLANKEARDKLLQATILTDDQWEEFRQLFDKVHTGYLHRLRVKLPSLSPAETRYMVLSKLNLTAKEMSSMLGVRPDAIRLYRHRLRKKLNIEDDKGLEDLMKNI